MHVGHHYRIHIVCCTKAPSAHCSVLCFGFEKIIKIVKRDLARPRCVASSKSIAENEELEEPKVSSHATSTHTLGDRIGSAEIKKLQNFSGSHSSFLNIILFPFSGSSSCLRSLNKSRAHIISLMCTFVVPQSLSPESTRDCHLYYVRTHAVRESKVMQHARISRYVFIIHAKNEAELHSDKSRWNQSIPIISIVLLLCCMCVLHNFSWNMKIYRWCLFLD